MKNFVKQNVLYILILVLAILAISPLKILSFFAVILLGAYYLPLQLDFYFKSLISFCILFALNTILAGICFIFKLPLSVSFVLILYLTLFLFLPKPIFNKKKLLEPFQKPVLFKVFISLVALIFLLLPMLSTQDNSAFRILGFGSDNISHIELVKVVEQHNGYYQTSGDITKNSMTEGLAGYPQGLHLNIWLLKQAARPIVDLSSPTRLIMYYTVYTRVMYVILAGLFFLLVGGVSKRSSSKMKQLIAICAVIVLFSGLFYSLLALGSQTQIAAFALLFSLLYLLTNLYDDSQKDNHQRFTILAIVLLCGISFTWLFLLPAAGLIVFLCLLDKYLVRVIQKPLSNMGIILAAIIGGLVVMIQPVIQVLDSSPTKGGITEVGYTIQPSIYIVSIFVLVAVAFLMLIQSPARRLWAYALASSSVFSIAVYVDQYIQVGSARYYFYKSLYSVIAVSLIIILISLGNVFDIQIKNLSKKLSFIIAGIVLVCSALGLLYNVTNPKDFVMLSENGGFSKELSVTSMKLITNQPQNGKKIISVGSCNRGFDYNLTRFTGVLTGDNDAYRQALVMALLSNKKEELLDAVKQYQKVRSPDLIIVSSDQSIQNYLEANLTHDGFGNEQFIDLDFNNVPRLPATCPEAVY